MAGKENRPIIVVRKVKKRQGTHHGGSWKVAYADFVTAMMALFMVLWILGLDQTTKESIQEYFSNPAGVKKGYASGSNPLMPGGKPMARFTGREAQERQFEALAERLREKLDAAGIDALDAIVEIVITDEGLRIELIEGKGGETFFAVGSAVLKPAAQRALQVIAGELRPLAHDLVVEGHTDAARYGSAAYYTNWELSADRANAARRAVEQGGVQNEKIVEVRGYADRHLRVVDNPLDPSNRRISVLLPYREVRPQEISAEGVARSPDRPNAGGPGAVAGSKAVAVAHSDMAQ